MPLRVSSTGWVKVAPPPKKPPQKKYINAEEEREALCSPLRYFACQAIDPGRERLRMLGNRVVYDNQDDALRPHSRVEKRSTLDQWRFDVTPSRSSSRQSGTYFESPSPPRNDESNGNSSPHGRENVHRGDPKSASSREDNPHRERRKGRTASAPIIISRSPPASACDEADDVIEVEEHPDNVSIAYTETPSERHCKHKHRHHKPNKAPTAIPEEEEEEEEPELNLNFPANPAPTRVPTPASSEIVSLCKFEDETESPIAVAAPPPSIAASEICQNHRVEINVPATIPESAPLSIPEPSPVSILQSAPASITDSVSVKTVSEADEKLHRSNRSDRSSQSSRSSRSDRSSRSSRSSGSSRSSASYRSRDTGSESSYSESTYTESVRSASPVRNHKHERYDYEDDETASRYPSPPPSPLPMHRKPRYEPKTAEDPLRAYRDRSVTTPLPKSRTKAAMSSSTWTSSSSLSSGSSVSGKSSAPSMDGYEFQAAIFQPKNNYRGYRAPSLSKGNRWETATSALSFD